METGRLTTRLNSISSRRRPARWAGHKQRRFGAARSAADQCASDSILTCGGGYRGDYSYDSRAIVVATPL